MSLLMFEIDPAAGVIILTDTLATTTDGSPMRFVAKCYAIPHMQIAMAGTGNGALLQRWATALWDRVLSLDIDMLAMHAPVALRTIQTELDSEFGLQETTSTIYHFGQTADGEFVWYAFRSTADFAAERRTEAALAVKPEPIGGLADVASIADKIALALRIRAEQDARPAPERIYVGGELWLTALQPGAFVQTRVYQFDDMLDDWEAMNDAARRWHDAQLAAASASTVDSAPAAP